jgi:shikimate dehydrogenase
MGIDGEYRLYPVPPLPEGREALAEMVERVRRGEVDGLNVTIPHKANVPGLLDRLTPLAQQAEAANTLYRQGDELWGDITDVPGLLADLRAWLPEKNQAGRKALILGAGGSARATAVALLAGGWGLAVAARRREQADRLAKSLEGWPDTRIECLELTPDGLARLKGIGLVVNSTPLGMWPLVEGCPWPGELPLPEGAAVYDLIYNPAETALLRKAREQGLPARNGLGMLVEQGALSLERWSGRAVPRDAMWKAVKSR